MSVHCCIESPRDCQALSFEQVIYVGVDEDHGGDDDVDAEDKLKLDHGQMLAPTAQGMLLELL